MIINLLKTYIIFPRHVIAHCLETLNSVKIKVNEFQMRKSNNLRIDRSKMCPKNKT